MDENIIVLEDRSSCDDERFAIEDSFPMEEGVSMVDELIFRDEELSWVALEFISEDK